MLKHKKYVYVEVTKEEGKKKRIYYVKVRVLKSRDNSDPQKYIVLDLVRTGKPRTAKVLSVDVLPTDVKQLILSKV
ncbi:MAG: DUF5622 domain-containing protein [Sulfolobales archaeon]|jgi:hypothetical protein|nr:DUF5622 domain-containing protein [Sulfolobales archaeon]MCG2883539.1 DUF5622 domain-containing protein [Sulfolobales archaeon]MCG2908231.1 DUF5622 domain-containing protein [Sulfolobales archaeon]PVU72703.1 hypothetical protein DDW10_03775 [Sulfolobales archaeon SCGC AB-777_J03]